MQCWPIFAQIRARVESENIAPGGPRRPPKACSPGSSFSLPLDGVVKRAVKTGLSKMGPLSTSPLEDPSVVSSGIPVRADPRGALVVGAQENAVRACAHPCRLHVTQQAHIAVVFHSAAYPGATTCGAPTKPQSSGVARPPGHPHQCRPPHELLTTSPFIPNLCPNTTTLEQLHGFRCVDRCSETAFLSAPKLIASVSRSILADFVRLDRSGSIRPACVPRLGWNLTNVGPLLHIITRLLSHC